MARGATRGEGTRAVRFGRRLYALGRLGTVLLFALHVLALSFGIGFVMLAVVLWNGVLLLFALICFRGYAYLLRVEAALEIAAAEGG